MSDFIQPNQQVGKQYNADQINVYQGAAPAVPPPKSLWTVPYLRNPFFTGRKEILRQLHENLITTHTTALTQAISGLGGIDKTQIAVEYAHLYREYYKYVLWVNAATYTTATENFATIGRLLHLPEQIDTDQSKVKEAVHHWLNQHDHWLLILDNADDLNIASDLIPTGGSGHLLLTTREQAVNFLAHPLEVTNRNEIKPTDSKEIN